MNIAVLSLMNFVLIIFIVLLLHKGRKRYSNIMLAVYFISQVIGIFDGFIYYAYPVGQGIPFTIYPAIFTWAPLFFFYINSLLDDEYRINWKHTVHFIPFLVVFIYTCFTFYFKNYETRLALTSNYQTQIDLNNKFSLIFNLQIVGYNIWEFVKYKKYQLRLKEEFSTINSSASTWLKTSLFGFLIACFIVQIGIHGSKLGLFSYQKWYIIGNLAFLAFFTILFYKAIVSPEVLAQSSIKEKYKQSGLNQSEAKKILVKLEEVMDIQMPFTDSTLTLKTLSKQSDISERVLSQIINEHRQQNFFDFINSYRVKYAMELLKNRNNSKRTMLDILFESGFNSKSTFNTAFKKHCGITPSEFKNKNMKDK